MRIYRTKKGDTWDNIAFSLWGNEYLMLELIKLNWKHRETIVFSEGITLLIPDIETDDTEDAPDWMHDEEFLEDDAQEVEENDAEQSESW